MHSEANMSDEQPTLPFPDATVSKLISTTISITTYEGLPATVAGATREQLETALQLLPDELRRGRAPVLAAAIAKREAS
jgi:hypothetical protein